MPDINNTDSTSLLVRELLSEKRSERRWKNIRFALWFALIAATILGIFSLSSDKGLSQHERKHVALIRLEGMIAPGREFSSDTLVPLLEQTFANKSVTGILIDINSPGGTPVQAAIIHDAILSLKAEYHKKVVVVGEDMLTSGAYYVAVAGDQIYVNPNTLTGSIGVIMKGFGFVDFMKKVGVERRVYVAGSDKDRLDPFLPQTPEDLAKVNEVMTEVHENFSQAVLEGRKGKLKGDPKTLFTGDFWSGQSAVKLGLADGLGNLSGVMRKEFNTTHYKEYSASSNWLKVLSGQMNSALDAMFYT